MLLPKRSHSKAHTASPHFWQRTVWISITSICITAGSLLKDAIAPIPVQAAPLRANLMLDVQSGETYAAFMQRATAAARTATQSTFDRNGSISDLAIVVTAQNQGAMVQVLTLRANRNQWRSNPNAGRWATYYPTAQSLLGLAAPVPAATTANAQSGNTQQPGTEQQPGATQPLVPGQPVIVLPFVPGQPVQVSPAPNGSPQIPIGSYSGSAIAPNTTTTQPRNSGNGTNLIPSSNAPVIPFPTTTPSSGTTPSATTTQPRNSGNGTNSIPSSNTPTTSSPTITPSSGVIPSSGAIPSSGILPSSGTAPSSGATPSSLGQQSNPNLSPSQTTPSSSPITPLSQ